MIINHERRFIFFHVPKTAGSSIRAALASLPGSVRQGQKHQTPRQFERASIFNLRYRLYFRFCFVRDPWERFGSLHRFLATRKHTQGLVPADVNDFALALDQREPWLMRRKSIRPQYRYARYVSFVGKFESIEQDFARIAARIGLPDTMLRRVNTSGHPLRYRDGMTACTQNIIAAYYSEDIARFGYR